jgi:membrane protein required for colicin V production
VTAFDYVVLAVIGLSVLVSVLRGALRELLSLLAWSAAAFLAIRFAPAVATLLPAVVSNQTLRLAVAFVLLLVMCVLLLSLVVMALSALLRKSGLSGTDRLLGAAFGFARGIVILVALTLLAGFTELPRQAVWRGAMFSAPLEALALWVRSYLPEAVAARIRYD